MGAADVLHVSLSERACTSERRALADNDELLAVSRSPISMSFVEQPAEIGGRRCFRAAEFW